MSANPTTMAIDRQAVLSVQQLSVSVPVAGQPCTLVKGIDLELHPGEVLGLVGESGCGKSLTGNALLGLLPTPQASLQSRRFVLGKDQNLSHASEAQWRKVRGRHIAMIFQEPRSALDPVFTIGQQMQRTIRRHLSGSRQQALEIASDSLASCGLAEIPRILNSYPHQLSGGMRQRVMIAMALSCKPEVLVADEPTSALDISSRDQVLALLRQAADRFGTAILLISHDLSAVASICDQTLVMYAGAVLESGPTSRVLTNPQHPYTAALLRATPRISSLHPLKVQAIEGRVESLHVEQRGCAYASRCQRVTELCKQTCPELNDEAEPGHSVACHHALLDARS